MKKSLKYISLIIALAFIIMGTVAVVYATGDGGEAADPGVDIPIEDDPVVVDPDPVQPDPDPVQPDPDPVQQDPDPGYSEEPVYSDPVYTDPGYSEDPLWYGDNSDRDYGDTEGAAGSVSDSTKLFDTKSKTDAEVAPITWKNITLNESTTKSGSGSFSSIKASTGSTNNTKSNIILFIGYILIALSVLGILYFIIATVSASKQNRRERRHNAHNADYYESQRFADEPKTSQRTAGHYVDGYDGYSRRSSKADTGEVHVPRRAR